MGPRTAVRPPISSLRARPKIYILPQRNPVQAAQIDFFLTPDVFDPDVKRPIPCHRWPPCLTSFDTSYQGHLDSGSRAMCRSAAGCSLLPFALGSPLRPFPCGALPAAAFPEPRRQRATSASGGGWPPITGRPAGAPDGPGWRVTACHGYVGGYASFQCAVHRGQFPTGLGDRPRTRG